MIPNTFHLCLQSRHVSVYNSLSELKGLSLTTNKKQFKSEEEVQFRVSLETSSRDTEFKMIYGDGTTSVRNGTDMYKHKYGRGGVYTATVVAQDVNRELGVNIIPVQSHQ